MTSLKNDSLKRNALINAIRQLSTIIFPMITFPYIARIMGSENLGEFSFTASIISYISLVAGLGISNYAVREGSRLRDEKEKLNKFVGEIFSLNILALIVAYIILAVIMLFFADSYDYRILLLIQAATVFFNVIGCEWLNTVFEDYLFITVRYIILQTIAVVLMLCFVKSPSDLFLYATLCQFANITAGIINLIYFYSKRGVKLSLVCSKFIFRHLKSVLILFGNAVSMLIYVNSDITIIGVICDDSQVGIYSVAVKVYTIVKQLLNALMVVGIPRMANWVGKKSQAHINSQLDEILKTLLVLLIPCMVGLFCLSDCAVIIMSGYGFQGAQNALRVLSFALFFSTGVCFYSNLVLIPHNMESYILKATSISAALNIVLNIIFIPYFGFIAAAYTTLVAECTTVMYMIFVTRKIYFPSVKKTFVISVISGVFVLIICLTVQRFVENIILRTFVSVLLSLVVWVIVRKITSMKSKGNNESDILAN